MRNAAWRVLTIVALLAVLASAVPWMPAASAVSPDIVISQVYGGGGNTGAVYTHDFIELFNRGSVPVSLAGWSVQYASATGTGNFGSTSTQITELPPVSLQPGQYLLVQEAMGSGGTTSLPTPDVTDTSPIAMSASSGKVIVASTNTGLGCNGGSTPCSPAQLALIVDLVGYGSANFYEGSAAPGLSNTTAAFRVGDGCIDTDENSADFTADTAGPRNSLSPFNVCGGPTPPTGVGTADPAAVFPGDNSLLTVAVTPGANPPSTGLAVEADLSSIGSSATQPFFDDGTNGDVTAGDNTFSYLAAVAAVTAPGAKSMPAVVSDAEGRSSNASIALSVLPPLVAIHDIQGATHISPRVGELVTTEGIVTAVRSNSFWMQDPIPDANDATSEGIVVYTGSSHGLAVGDAVQVSGTVVEFRPGGSGGFQNLTTTELSTPGLMVTVLGDGNPLPSATVIGDGGRVPPDMIIEDDATGDVETSGVFDPSQDGIDFYESLEGMRLQLNQPLAVGPTNSFGELALVSDNGANASVFTPRSGLVIRPDDYNPERVIVDDTLVDTPDVATGAVLDTVTGVLDYSFGNFKLLPTEELAVLSDTLVEESIGPGAAYQLSVSSFNVENLSFVSSAAKFAGLAGQIVNNLQSPDVVAVQEIQDNTGPADDGVVDAGLTFGRLIQAIQDAGGPVYDYRQINPLNNEDGGAPGSNIRVGFLFQPSRVSFVDRPGGTATNSTGVVLGTHGPELTYSPGRIDPTNGAFFDSRKPLAGEFSFYGDTVFVVVNHFNSKGGDDPLFGRYQPPFLGSEPQRLDQATVVNAFVDDILTLDADANVVVLGDLNDFQFSSPLAVLKGSVLNNLVDTLPLSERYTYIYDGNSQTLDHTLLSGATFGRPWTFDVVHTNAEFPPDRRPSDHDPQVAKLCVDATPPVLNVSVTPDQLWPPNHKLVDVSATVSVSDNADPMPVLTFVSVTSNEPDDGLGDGDTSGDFVIVSDTEFQLRAERSGLGDGRVYTITYEATDACGNSTVASAMVTVPHDRGKK